MIVRRRQIAPDPVRVDLTKILNNVIKWAALVAIAMIYEHVYPFYVPTEVPATTIESGSADETTAPQGKKDTASPRVTNRATQTNQQCAIPGAVWLTLGLAFAFGIAAIAYARKVEQLAMAAIERLGPVKVAQEKQIDPGRTSSKLSAKGKPRKDDL